MKLVLPGPAVGQHLAGQHKLPQNSDPSVHESIETVGKIDLACIQA
jgi:hypothetical protein